MQWREAEWYWWIRTSWFPNSAEGNTETVKYRTQSKIKPNLLSSRAPSTTAHQRRFLSARNERKGGVFPHNSQINQNKQREHHSWGDENREFNPHGTKPAKERTKKKTRIPPLPTPPRSSPLHPKKKKSQNSARTGANLAEPRSRGAQNWGWIGTERSSNCPLLCSSQLVSRLDSQGERPCGRAREGSRPPRRDAATA